ncbi:hypothetical protein DFJ74DRAFT_604492 [Hyaloraphidium curvatum]|nr:hypothetical protein DFJ74DRAFT_604492 [Hyaloraphidium curvatum]
MWRPRSRSIRLTFRADGSIRAGTAAFSAEEAIHELQPSAEVLVIGSEKSLPYMRPPLSKELWTAPGDAVASLSFTSWDGKARSIYYAGAEKWAQTQDPSEEASAKTKLVFATVSGIDLNKKTVQLASGETFRYGKLLLATGGTPKSLADVPEAGNVTTFRTVADFSRLRTSVAGSTKEVVVVGGGFLGSELTVALAKHAAKVTQVFPEEGNLARILPKYLSQWLTDRLRETGAAVLSGHEVKAIEEADGKVAVQVSPVGGGDSVAIAADEVVLCLGIDPNVQVGRDAGLQIDEDRGGLLVDAELKTSSPDVYAAGDVASYADMILGQTRSEHHDSAVMTGRVAGQNMCGTKRKYIYQPFFWTDLGSSIGIEGCGLLDPSLPTVGIWAKESDDGKQRKGAVFYLSPDKQIVGIALVNMYGKASAAREVIRRKRKVEQVEDLAGIFDLSTAPPAGESD